ncbi:hypothetical protein GCM10022419_015900 [Nonomuraea rosea]|uniref:Uncharacterized protein n=1 Tax=Nonomuraea rosea TaxID=638574 RepID=A0ABP6VKU9_9ACTN
MVTVESLRAEFGTVWEIHELRWDWAASRRKSITQLAYEGGHLQVLMAPDLDGLAVRLAQQAALEDPDRVLNGVMLSPAELPPRSRSRFSLTTPAGNHDHSTGPRPAGVQFPRQISRG